MCAQLLAHTCMLHFVFPALFSVWSFSDGHHLRARLLVPRTYLFFHDVAPHVLFFTYVNSKAVFLSADRCQALGGPLRTVMQRCLTSASSGGVVPSRREEPPHWSGVAQSTVPGTCHRRR